MYRCPDDVEIPLSFIRSMLVITGYTNYYEMSIFCFDGDKLWKNLLYDSSENLYKFALYGCSSKITCYVKEDAKIDEIPLLCYPLLKAYENENFHAKYWAKEMEDLYGFSVLAWTLYQVLNVLILDREESF